MKNTIPNARCTTPTGQSSHLTTEHFTWAIHSSRHRSRQSDIYPVSGCWFLPSLWLSFGSIEHRQVLKAKTSASTINISLRTFLSFSVNSVLLKIIYSIFLNCFSPYYEIDLSAWRLQINSTYKCKAWNCWFGSFLSFQLQISWKIPSISKNPHLFGGQPFRKFWGRNETRLDQCW